VRAAKAAGYVNAGTAEFLLDQAGNFYFLEVNARLQVEHPVTELVTGIDLVQEQLRIAAGEPLGFEQGDVQPRGYALECRIYAEDPANGFLPSTGTVRGYRPPAGPGVRLDSGVEENSTIGVYYDPMIAKLLVWAADRPRGLARMRRALHEFLVLGVRTSIPLHQWILAQPAFERGEVDTGWLERELRMTAPDEDELRAAALAAALLVDEGRTPAAPPVDGRAPAPAWRLTARREALR
jgi:acetyl/propionyl-CoA carboxylase alpha subunit